MDDESIVAHVSWIGEYRQRRELDEAESAMVARAGRTLERRETRLRLEVFHDVLPRTGLV